jgi:Cft2 family RNA processing exonuclease
MKPKNPDIKHDIAPPLQTSTHRLSIKDLNFERDIGANCLYFELGPFRVIVDCGTDPKRMGNAALPNFSKLEPHSIDYIVITHSHLDHVGSLPLLLKKHPMAKVLISYPTSIIAPRMLYNSYNVMCKQREEHNVKEYPLFHPTDIDNLSNAFIPMNYNRPIVLKKEKESLEVTFFPAGHVLGASGVQVMYKHRKIFFTGDVLFRNQETLDGARFPKHQIDSLIIETTRGNTERNPEVTATKEQQRLIRKVHDILHRGGSVLIPAFALGRMQEILSILHQAIKQKCIPHVPVFCSGLGVALMDSFDEISRKTGLVRFRRKILKELKVKPFQTSGKRAALQGKKPSIYVLSSGMLVENTPSYRAAFNLIESSLNGLCFVGYCDPETPGGQLIAASHGSQFDFRAFDYTATIKASIDCFDLSGHADREEIVNFALSVNPRAIVLSHGNASARNWFAKTILDLHPTCKIIDPEPGMETIV